MVPLVWTVTQMKGSILNQLGQWSPHRPMLQLGGGTGENQMEEMETLFCFRLTLSPPPLSLCSRWTWGSTWLEGFEIFVVLGQLNSHTYHLSDELLKKWSGTLTSVPYPLKLFDGSEHHRINPLTLWNAANRCPELDPRNGPQLDRWSRRGTCMVCHTLNVLHCISKESCGQISFTTVEDSCNQALKLVNLSGWFPALISPHPLLKALLCQCREAIQDRTMTLQVNGRMRIPKEQTFVVNGQAFYCGFRVQKNMAAATSQSLHRRVERLSNYTEASWHTDVGVEGSKTPVASL